MVAYAKEMIVYMVLVHAGAKDYIETIRRTWATYNGGRRVIFVAGRGCEHLQGDDILHVDTPDDYDGIIEKKAEGFRLILEMFPSATYIVKVDPDIIIFPGHEALVFKVGADLMGGGYDPTRNVSGCCAAYSRIAAELIVSACSGEIPEWHPDDLSWELARIGIRNRIYRAEDVYATQLINAASGLVPHCNSAICIGYHMQHISRIRPFTVSFVELSPEGIQAVFDAKDKKACLDKAQDRALICQGCSNRIMPENSGENVALGGSKCHLTTLTINHFRDDTCPEGLHAEDKDADNSR